MLTNILKTALVLIFWLVMLCIALSIIESVVKIAQKKPPYYKCGGIKEYLTLLIHSIFPEGKTLANALLVIIILGGTWFIAAECTENNIVQYRGVESEHEKNETTYDYEALFYTCSGDYTSIEAYLPCIATVYRDSYSDYTVTYIRFPRGKAFELNESIRDSNVAFNEMYELEVGPVHGGLILIAPATHASISALDKSGSQYPTFLASNKGDTIHYSDCAYLERIKRKNLLHFSNEEEARLYGYELCDKCYKNHHDN